MPKMNVESFNLDHTLVDAPFIRVADRKQLPHGDVLTKYDVRFCQPNQAHLEMPVVHSLEHTMAENFRNHADYIVDFSPMGCQTGFYLIVVGDHPDEEIRDLLAKTLTDVVNATEVPAANEVQCGWGANHTLEGAQAAARSMLDRADGWGRVYREGVDIDSTQQGETAEWAKTAAEAEQAHDQAQGPHEDPQQAMPPQNEPGQGQDQTPEWAKNEAEAKQDGE